MSTVTTTASPLNHRLAGFANPRASVLHSPVVWKFPVVLCLWAIGIAALFYVYLQAWPGAPFLAGDTDEYLDFAQRLRTHTLMEPSNRLPGYPLLLALFGARVRQSVPGLFPFQLVLHGLTIWLVVLCCQRLQLSKRWYVPAALLLCLPPYVEAAALILTECLCSLLLLGMLYGLICWRQSNHWGYAVLSGLCGALAFMTRPVFLFLAPALALLTLIAVYRRHHTEQQQRFKKWLATASAVWAPSVATLFILFGINLALFNYAGLTPKAGFMLSTRTLRSLERLPDEHSQYREILIKARNDSMVARNSSHTGTQFMWDSGLIELMRITGKSKTELSGEILALNLKLIASAPLDYLSMSVQGMVNSWFPFNTPFASFGSRGLQFLWTALHFAVIALYALALCYFFTTGLEWLRGNRALAEAAAPGTLLIEAWLHFSIWYTCILSSLLEVGDPRYMRPVFPLVLLAVVIFVMRLQRRTAPEPSVSLAVI